MSTTSRIYYIFLLFILVLASSCRLIPLYTLLYFNLSYVLWFWSHLRIFSYVLLLLIRFCLSVWIISPSSSQKGLFASFVAWWFFLKHKTLVLQLNWNCVPAHNSRRKLSLMVGVVLFVFFSWHLILLPKHAFEQNKFMSKWKIKHRYSLFLFEK